MAADNEFEQHSQDKGFMYEISVFEVEFRLWRGVLDTTLCDRVCQ